MIDVELAVIELATIAVRAGADAKVGAQIRVGIVLRRLRIRAVGWRIVAPVITVISGIVRRAIPVRVVPVRAIPVGTPGEPPVRSPIRPSNTKAPGPASPTTTTVAIPTPAITTPTVTAVPAIAATPTVSVRNTAGKAASRGHTARRTERVPIAVGKAVIVSGKGSSR